jgi:hypothetical protein
LLALESAKVAGGAGGEDAAGRAVSAISADVASDRLQEQAKHWAELMTRAKAQ